MMGYEDISDAEVSGHSLANYLDMMFCGGNCGPELSVQYCKTNGFVERTHDDHKVCSDDSCVCSDYKRIMGIDD